MLLCEVVSHCCTCDTWGMNGVGMRGVESGCYKSGDIVVDEYTGLKHAKAIDSPDL